MRKKTKIIRVQKNFNLKLFFTMQEVSFIRSTIKIVIFKYAIGTTGLRTLYR